jgi:hypothetical protein
MDEFDRLEKSTKSDKDSDNIAHLEHRLERERDLRLEERFVWLVIVLMLLDWHVFQDIASWAGIISIFILQLVVLLILAKKWGVDVVHVWLDKVLQSYRGNDEK